MFDNGYISLEVLAVTLALPQKYLRELAETKRIPVLNVNGRLRFNSESVQDALEKLATDGGAHADE